MPTEAGLIDAAQSAYPEFGVETLKDALEAFYMDGTMDEAGGDVEAPCGHFYRVDQWMVVTDSHGNKTVTEFDSVDAAMTYYAELDKEWASWANEEMEY